MQINIEFTGISRVLTGQTSCTLALAPGDSLQQVVAALGIQYPALKGEILEKDGQKLIPTNLFSLNGEKILRESDLQFQPKDGDKLILLSLLAGG
jgi:molybdopterin converting factor small subunit